MSPPVSWSDLPLLPHHTKVLRTRGITPEVALAHGYRSSRGEKDLRSLGYQGALAEVSGALVIPLHNADGDVISHQIRPDDEVAGRNGRVLKYATPPGKPNVVDIPVSLGARGNDVVSDPSVPIIVTEGPLKAAAAASRGIPCVSIQGVSCYVGSTSSGGKGSYLADWRQFANNREWIIGYDSDAMTKPDVLKEARRLGTYLGGKPGATVRYLMLPSDTDKMGLDDWLVSHPHASLSELYDLVTDELPDPDAVTVQNDGREMVHATDLEISDCYVSHYGDEVRYLTDLGKWVGYSDGRWDLTGGDSVARANGQDLFRTLLAYQVRSDGNGGTRKVDATEWLYQSSRLDACLAQVRSNRVMQARADDLNKMPLLLNVDNGTVELVTGLLQPHDPRDLLTQKTDVEYAPGAECPEFLKFIGEVLPDDDVRGFVQRLFGMALLGEVRDHVFAVFTGTGRNGKGVLLRIAQAVFGDYATGINKDLLLKTNFEGHPTHLATLYGRRLAVAQELERDAKWDVSRVKELTGGDHITARWMRGNEFTFTPSHTLVMASNHRPAVGEGERAFWSRYREVPFTETFEGREDVTLADRIIANELPGVLLWMLDGLSDYQRDGLGNPAAVVRASQDAREESDPMLRFLHETIEVTPGSEDKVPTKELYDRWTTWAATESSHITIGSYLHFGRAVKAATSSVEVGKTSSGPLKGVSMILHARWRDSSDGLEEVDPTPGGGTEEVVVDLREEVDAGQTSVEEVEEVEEVKPQILLYGESRTVATPITYENPPLSRYRGVIASTSSRDQLEAPEVVTESEQASSEVPPVTPLVAPLVTIGIDAEGRVLPGYNPSKPDTGERVTVAEYERRVRVAGFYREPVSGWSEAA